MIQLHLLTPFQLGDLYLKNRLVLAPMTKARAGKARLANALMAEYYRQRSPSGLLMTEATTISSQANGWNESFGMYTVKVRLNAELNKPADMQHWDSPLGAKGYTVTWFTGLGQLS